MRNGYPFIDLHRHLDGNVRLSTILDLAKKHKIFLPTWDIDLLKKHVQVVDPTPDLMSFIAKFEFMRLVMVDYAAIDRIVQENLQDAAKENIDYIELRFSPYFMAETHQLDPFQVTETVCHAVQKYSFGIKAKLIAIMSRTYGTEKCWLELQTAVQFKNQGIVAVDLAGDEANFPGSLFVKHFQHAQEHGLHTIAHAGEASGFESVRQAILELKAERIGHAVYATQDQETMDMLREKKIGVESCPTSNIQTSTVKSYSEHPIREFLKNKLKVTLNTDDPGISGIDLEHEYKIAQDKIGLSLDDILQLQKNALEVAFLTEEEKRQLLKNCKGK
jgi:adenosine deaminase